MYLHTYICIHIGSYVHTIVNSHVTYAHYIQILLAKAS